MKSRCLIAILMAAWVLGAPGRRAEASIVLSYSLNGNGEARLMSVESALMHAIQLNIEGSEGLFAVLIGEEVADDGTRLPVLRLRPLNAIGADSAIAGNAYLTFSFQTDSTVERSLQGDGVGMWPVRTLEFNVSRKGGAGDFGCLVQSSLDGFGTDRPVLVANPVAVEGSDKIRYSVDISPERFQDLSEVDFRVYFYSTTPDETLEFDGFRLKGEVIVAPEPSSSLVWGLTLTVILFVAAIGWIARRNRPEMAYAMAGGDRPPADGRHKPWSEATRQSILDIIDRGRTG